MLEAEKIPTRKISEIVVDQLEQWIESGKVEPGEKLPSVRELCEMFDVGRSAVRDALTTLKGRGLVQIKQGEGAYVCHTDISQRLNEILLVTKRDIHQLYQVRKILEVGIVEMAAVHATQEHLDAMKNALKDLASAHTLEGWVADYHLHRVISEASGNPILSELMETLSATIKKGIRDTHRVILSDRKLAESVAEQHIAIFHAIESGDPSKAREAMYNHLVFVEELLDRNLQKSND